MEEAQDRQGRMERGIEMASQWELLVALVNRTQMFGKGIAYYVLIDKVRELRVNLYFTWKGCFEVREQV